MAYSVDVGGVGGHAGAADVGADAGGAVYIMANGGAVQSVGREGVPRVAVPADASRASDAIGNAAGGQGAGIIDVNGVVGPATVATVPPVVALYTIGDVAVGDNAT